MTEKRSDITPAVVARLLEYDPLTGLFRRTLDAANGRRAGEPVGTKAANGYVMIRLLGKIRLAHRLAWAISFGRWPTHCIDHINRDRADNRLANLRDVPLSANAKNHPRRPLLVGAVPSPEGKWLAAVHRYGEAQAIGEFDSPEAANAAWLDAQKRVKKPDAPRPRLQPAPPPEPRGSKRKSKVVRKRAST